jgi:hypothetical protein
LPEKFFSDVACSVGRKLDAKVDRRWLFKGRRVYLYDGSTVSMPDTPENQEAYPQGSRQFSEAGIAEKAGKPAQLREDAFNSLSAWTPATNSNRRCVRDGSTSIGWSISS